jgi:hypothetical protein
MSRRSLGVVIACLAGTVLIAPATAGAAAPECSPATGLEANVQAGESIVLPRPPCTDADGDDIDIEVTQAPVHGTFDPPGTQSIDTQRTYTADADAGDVVDTVKFRAVAGGENSNEATLEINISANHAPVCPSRIELSVMSGEQLVLTGNPCSDADGDPLTLVLVDAPDHGTLTGPSNGSYTYTPAAGYSGPDSLRYRAEDASTQSNVVTLAINVTPRPAPPPTPTTTGGSTAPSVTPPPPDLVPPTASLTAPRAQLVLRRVLARGVPLTLSTTEPSRAVIRVLLSRRAARRLGVDRKARRAVVVGRLSRDLPAGESRLAVKLTRKARRRLAKARTVSLTLDVRLADAAGNVRFVKRVITVRRKA